MANAKSADKPVVTRSAGGVFDLNQYNTDMLNVRLWAPGDQARCEELYDAGMDDLLQLLFRENSKSPYIITVISVLVAVIRYGLPMLYPPAGPLIGSGGSYWYLPFVIVPLVVLAFNYYRKWSMITHYIVHSKASAAEGGDFRNIQKHYLESAHGKSCFWVVTLKQPMKGTDGTVIIPADTVVGMVALDYNKPDTFEAELRRMSVDRRVRRARIGSVLCDVVRDWCLYVGGVKSIYLTTGQIAAFIMYEKNGYATETSVHSWWTRDGYWKMRLTFGK